MPRYRKPPIYRVKLYSGWSYLTILDLEEKEEEEEGRGKLSGCALSTSCVIEGEVYPHTKDGASAVVTRLGEITAPVVWPLCGSGEAMKDKFHDQDRESY